MDLIERIRQEAREIRRAPFSFVVFLSVGAAAGYFASNFYYAKQISDKDSQIGRYQVVLGIKAGSEGALVELNNEELELRAESIVAKLRGLDSALDARFADIKKTTG